MHRPTLSVVIPAKNEAEHLPLALRSIHAELAGAASYEVIVVDHGSTDGTPALARDQGARVVHHPRGTISELRNIGADHTSGSLLAFIDADVVLRPGWRTGLAEARDIFAAEPLTLCGDLYGIGDDPSWIDRAWYDPAMRPKANFLSGGNMLTTRECFERVGGFNTALETGEDADFCRRVEAAGGRVRRLPSLVTHHLGNPKTLRGFMLREAWHGAGDFVSLSTVVDSRVAQVALMWLALHIAVVGLLIVSPVWALLCWLAAVGLAAVSALAKYGTDHLPARTLLYYAYFAGRSLAALRRVSPKRPHRRSEAPETA